MFPAPTPVRHTLAAALFVVFTGAAASATADIDKTSKSGYEVWDVSGMEVYDLSDGETLSNILVDQTGSGNTLTIRSRNKSGWTVENIGFKGVGTDGDGSNSFQFQVSAPSGGSGTIENVWMNNKTRNGEQADVLGGIYIRSSHAGHIDIRHTWIEGFGNNAVYGSSVGKDGHSEGSVTIENAYHRDNTVSQFRIGSPGSVVRNSVGVIDDPQGLRASYPSSDSKNARGIWGKHFRDQRIENSAFYVSSDDVQPDSVFEARYIENRSNGPEAVLKVVDCDINMDVPRVKDSTDNARVEIQNLGHDPSVDVIQDGGVPTSATMAARGNREMPPRLPGEDPGNDEMLPKTLEIDASEFGRAEYEVAVDGELEAASNLGSLEDEDQVSGSSANGVVDGEVDGFRFSGTITDFQLIAEATVSVDGSTVDPSSLGDHYPHTLQIDGRDADRTDYRFTVSEAVIEYEYLGGMGKDDEITGRTAEGFVNGGTDGYAFSGSITDFEIDGGADVIVDGEPFDVAACCTSNDDAGPGTESDTGIGADAVGGDSGADGGRDSGASEGAGCRTAGSAPPAGCLFFAVVLLAGRLRHRSSD